MHPSYYYHQMLVILQMMMRREEVEAYAVLMTENYNRKISRKEKKRRKSVENDIEKTGRKMKNETKPGQIHRFKWKQKQKLDHKQKHEREQ